MTEGDVFTRRQYLLMRAMLEGASTWLALEAVSSTAIEHPELSMSEERTWAEWESDD